MKKIFFFTAITFLTLSSCRKEATTLSQDQTVAEGQLQTNASSSQTETNASSSGGAFTFHDDFTLNWEGTQLYNPCTNELMTLSGDTYVTVHGIYNGAKSTMTVHANGQQIKAVGESGRLILYPDQPITRKVLFPTVYLQPKKYILIVSSPRVVKIL